MTSSSGRTVAGADRTIVLFPLDGSPALDIHARTGVTPGATCNDARPSPRSHAYAPARGAGHPCPHSPSLVRAARASEPMEAIDMNALRKALVARHGGGGGRAGLPSAAEHRRALASPRCRPPRRRPPQHRRPPPRRRPLPRRRRSPRRRHRAPPRCRRRSITRPSPHAPRLTPAGCLSPGTYQLSDPSAWPVTVTLDVPAGWLELPSAPAGRPWLSDPGGAGLGLGRHVLHRGDVAHDPCDSTKGWIPAAQVDTPQKLAAAMAAWPHFTATTRQPITLDGHRGVRFTLAANSKSTCTDQGFAGHGTAGASSTRGRWSTIPVHTVR